MEGHGELQALLLDTLPASEDRPLDSGDVWKLAGDLLFEFGRGPPLSVLQQVPGSSLDVATRFHGGQSHVNVVVWSWLEQAHNGRKRLRRDAEERGQRLDHAAPDIRPAPLVEIGAQRLHQALCPGDVQAAQ